ncbi:hypothetical protein B0O99DRAFT_619713 [Bisporella sp. PMI_857]|nr:hypothetical protein B0O99DRAFT_619713 [Bisporella sp. PMI_857]
MAILDGLPGIRVTVQSNNSRRNEYPDTDTPLRVDQYTHPREGCATLKYLEVVAESEFIVKCEALAPYMADSDLSFTAEVDGTRIATLVARQANINSGYWHGVIDGYYKRIDSQQISSRPLRFSQLIKVDSDDSEQIRRDSRMMNKVGEITVYVHRTSPSGQEQVTASTDPRTITEVSEKALKGQAISHSVSYGAEKRISRPATAGTVYLDGFYNPLAIFRFKYRSKDALQALLIVARSPTPERIHLAPINPRDQGGINENPSRRVRLANLKVRKHNCA